MVNLHHYDRETRICYLDVHIVALRSEMTKNTLSYYMVKIAAFIDLLLVTCVRQNLPSDTKTPENVVVSVVTTIFRKNKPYYNTVFPPTNFII